MARSPFSFLNEVVMRTKSSPWRTKIVAMPPVAARNRSTAAKSRFSVVFPVRKADVFMSPIAITVLSSREKGSEK